MDAKTIAVLNANWAFYQALAVADFMAMRRLWLDSPDTICVHPGHPPLHGLEAILESWRQMLSSQGPLFIWPSEPTVRVFGKTAEVVCYENIETGELAGIVQTRAVNIFREVGRRWKMVEHHTRPAGIDAGEPLKPFSRN
jgi:ketosteroid isomerase-like protein